MEQEVDYDALPRHQAEVLERVFDLPPDAPFSRLLARLAREIEDRAEYRLTYHSDRQTLAQVVYDSDYPGSEEPLWWHDVEHLLSLFAWWQMIALDVLIGYVDPWSSLVPDPEMLTIARDRCPILFDLSDDFTQHWRKVRRMSVLYDTDCLFASIEPTQDMLKSYLVFTAAVCDLAQELFPGNDMGPLTDLL